MKCPICEEELTLQPQNPDYDTYVADDGGDCVQYSDGIDFYKCSNEHRIYIGKDD